MKRLLVLSLFYVSSGFAAEHDHNAATTSAESQPQAAAPATEHDHAAMQTAVSTDATNARLNAAVLAQTAHEHGGAWNYLVMLDRLERVHLDSGNEQQWEAQGWYGADYHKLWWKTEGHYNERSNALGRGELQALYSHAVAPFWDLQLGLRHDEGQAKSRSYAVLGWQGLAPYWFEVDSALFVSERGDASVRVEVEYELRLTQRLLLQPRLELNHAFADDAAAGVAQGLNDSSIGLRVRYEFLREVAPYVGVEWSVGEASGNSEARVMAGLRLWY